jgi:diaminohydroxyphosphoribosylaminopyrimidine deaminase / 5-amino-6-(5-phosphoribosylamino)uracil reductase
MKFPDERYMRRCFELALKGRGKVHPNPLVGAVVVQEDQIVGEGFHAEFGSDHAEIVALKQAGNRARGATLYVNLEPCNHSGNTPPCTHAIAEAGVANVVFPIKDPNPHVTGNGEAYLIGKSIKVYPGVLEAAAEHLNEKFIFAMRARMPYVTVKIAQTLDGYIADIDNRSKWITGDSARAYVREMRTENDAVLVGAGTILQDNPSLTLHERKGRQPYRVIIDGKVATNPGSRVYTDEFKDRTILITSNEAEYSERIQLFKEKGIEYIALDGNKGRIPIRNILSSLWERQINSILVEGGGAVFSQFLLSGLFSMAVVFISPRFLINGTRSVSDAGVPLDMVRPLHSVSVEKIGEDIMISSVSDLHRQYLIQQSNNREKE